MGDRCDVPGELRPAVEAVLARHDQLGVGERESGVPQLVVGGAAQARMVLPETGERGRLAGPAGPGELLGLLPVLLEVRTGGQLPGGHTNLLSSRAWSP